MAHIVTDPPAPTAHAGHALVVTISASYGAGGSVIAPRLAERLGVAWVDRLVSSTTASGEVSEHLTDEEAATTPGSRLFTYLARAVGVNAIAPPDSLVDRDEELRAQAEADITRMCAAGGVLLGRAGAVVLAGRPGAVHVRLDGPPERRIKQAAEIEGIDEEEAERRMAATDRARTLYVRRLYRADPNDVRHYHLVLDTTALGLDRAVDVLAAAVPAFRAAP